MARKRKAPSSQLAHEQKSKVIREEVKEEEEPVEEYSSEEEDEPVEESSSEEVEEEEESEEEIEEEIEEEVEATDDEEEEEEEPTDDASKREALRELLAPFAKSQLIDLLKKAAATDPQILPKIAQLADSDPTHRKIFVHGLGWDATSDQLIDSFAPFGEIEDSKLVTDKNTGRAKGYAFVLFKSRAAARKALRVPQKQIGSRMVSCQLAAIGPPSGSQPTTESADGSRKLYVGNVGPHVSPEELKSFFGKFGDIEDGPLGMDQVTNKFRGFAIITFRSPEGFNKAMEEPVKVFDNCQLHCKKFVENHNKNNAAASNAASVDVNYFNYSDLGANLNAAGLLMAQNPGIQLAGPAMLAAYNPAGLGALAGLGAPMLLGNYGSQAAVHGLAAYQNVQAGQLPVGTAGTSTRGPLGLGARMVGDGMLGSYGSQAALQGLRAFQNVQAGQSPVGTVGTSPMGRTSSVSAQNQNPFSSYFGR